MVGIKSTSCVMSARAIGRVPHADSHSSGVRQGLGLASLGIAWQDTMNDVRTYAYTYIRRYVCIYGSGYEL